MINERLLELRKEYNKAFDSFMDGTLKHEKWIKIERTLTKAKTKISNDYGEN